MNQVTIAGVIKGRIDKRYTPKGQAVVDLPFEIREQTKNGTFVTRVPVSFWGQLAENVATYCREGTELVVTGKLQTRQWQDKQGNQRESWSVNAFTAIPVAQVEAPPLDYPQPAVAPVAPKPQTEVRELTELDVPF